MISKKAESIKPYTPGEQPTEAGYVKLNTNENPYPLVGAPNMDQSDWAKIRLYPDPESKALTAAIANLNGVKPSNIFLGNGSDEVLALAFLALFDPAGKTVYIPDVTYSFYSVYAELFNIKYSLVPVSKALEIKPEDYYLLTNCQGIVMANPNAPTSLSIKNNAFSKMAIAYPDANIIVDEAYIDFGGETAVPLISNYPNIIVVRTLSKGYSLAGIRVGYAIASEDKIRALTAIKNSFNSYPLDKIAQILALQAVNSQISMKSNIKRVIETRFRLLNELSRMGFETLPPSANFVFTAHRKVKAKTIYEKLKEQKILVRYFDKPRIDNYLRITVGSDKDIDALIIALNKIV